MICSQQEDTSILSCPIFDKQARTLVVSTAYQDKIPTAGRSANLKLGSDGSSCIESCLGIPQDIPEKEGHRYTLITKLACCLCQLYFGLGAVGSQTPEPVQHAPVFAVATCINAIRK